VADLSQFKTVVRNTSGAERHFPFLPPHGRTLADDGDFIFKGDLFAVLWKNNGREFDALNTAVEAGDLTIIQTPTMARHDPTDELVKYVDVDNGAVVILDPVGGSYSGPAPSV
jgi:hypothetical protein